MSSRFPRGSEWRKWDLHVHTPESFHWNGSKRFTEMSDVEVTSEIEAILSKINASDIAVFATVDYWTFDGYMRIRKHIEQNPDSLNNHKSILPGIELRIEAPVDYRLNMQVILADDLSDQELRDFRHELKIRTIKRSISDDALIEFARSLSLDKAKIHGHKDYKENDQSALQLGTKTAEITKDSLEKALSSLPSRDKCLVVMPFDTTDGLRELDWEKHPQAANYFLQMPDIFESRKQETKDLFNGVRTDKNEKFFDSFYQSIGGSPKPVICGSDAHKTADYGNFPEKKATWIKANPTYFGLRQVLIEPEQRVFIGDVPPEIKRVQEDPTKVASSILINKTQGNGIEDKWFDVDLKLNPGLIAVIGNKGSGKSALADVFALLGNTSKFKDFSFLRKDRFRDPKLGIAQSYEASLTWCSGVENGPITLSRDPDLSDVERVSYIPQSYLEKICNEVSSERSNVFNDEIEEVIFSHIPESERYGRHSLRELIELKAEETKRSIHLFRERLSSLNEDLSELHNKTNPSHQTRIIKEYEMVLSDIKTLRITGRPKKIEKPQVEGENEAQIKNLVSKLEAFKKRRDQLQGRLRFYEKMKEEFLITLENAKKLRGRINNLKSEFNESRRGIKKLCLDLGLDTNVLVKLSINDKELKVLEDSTSRRLSKCMKRLDNNEDNSFFKKIKPIIKQIQKINDELTEPQRLYEAYISELRVWREKLKKLLGNSSAPSTARGLKEIIKSFDRLPEEISRKKEERLSLVQKIYEEKVQLKKLYTDLHSPVEQFIEGFAKTELENQLTFSASIVEVSFIENFLGHIHQGKIGSFSGTKEGEKVVAQLIGESEFNAWDGIAAFLHKLENLLASDAKQGSKGTSIRLEDQLLDRVSAADFEDFIYGLEYLEPEFEIGWAGKKLSQLSPGEKGNLLLVFYLLIDRSDMPLIIDQPEENLDNETVYKTLVPCVKEARKRRQVFLVTHNPNLAVACDADQVVHAEIDKLAGNLITYKSGAIEDIKMNRLLVNVLEGTRPAFDTRDAKYEISKD